MARIEEGVTVAATNLPQLSATSRQSRFSQCRLETVMTDDTHTMRSGGLTVIIKVRGAELCSLTNAAGVEFIWQAGPAWPRHAPLLLPIVGRFGNDELRHRGKTYRMTQHGFARDNRFAWAERG
jgi:galactose mutarotase-like enzyme